MTASLLNAPRRSVGSGALGAFAGGATFLAGAFLVAGFVPLLAVAAGFGVAFGSAALMPVAAAWLAAFSCVTTVDILMLSLCKPLFRGGYLSIVLAPVWN